MKFFKILACLIFGCKYKLIHQGNFLYQYQKKNLKKPQVICGCGKIYECQRCGNIRLGDLYEI